MTAPDWQKYYPVLQPHEFVCRCGCGLMNMQYSHMEMLYLARMMSGIPFLISSGSRCSVHNKNEGGSDTSDHLTGHGTDITVNQSRTRFIIFDSLLKVGFTRLGVGKNFIHAGNNPYNPPRVMWPY
jgi:zinc D-Ala-D-Ala carboxypeptidase